MSEATVKSGYELAKMLNVPLDEGVLVAVFPEALDDVLTEETSILDKKGNHCHVVTAKWGARRFVIDLQAPSGEEVKWWRVKQAPGDLLPIRYHGPISEIPQEYFDKDYILGIRFWQHGPFFFPKEQPRVTESTMEAALEAVEL